MLRGLSLPLAACGVLVWGTVFAFKGVDVTGQGYDGEFRLLGHDGKARTRTDFPGKVVVITFGFTRCPDVCPTSLATPCTRLRSSPSACKACSSPSIPSATRRRFLPST